MQSLQCQKCFRKCRNRGTLANHMKTHEKDIKSGSLLAFVKRAPAKKSAIVAIKKEPAPLQTKLSFSKRKEIPSIDANKAGPQGNPKPIPRKAVKEDLSPYVIPTSVIPSDADHKTPEYRIAIVKYYHRLTQAYPNLNKTTFHRANKFKFTAARFYQFFTEHGQDKSTIKKKE